MKYKNIGQSSLKTSIFGLGSLHFGVFLNQHESTKLIEKAFDKGINFIETSPIYGNGTSETIVGNAIQPFKEEIFVSTKFGMKAIKREDGSFGVDVEPQNQKNIIHSVDRSLKTLNKDVIDLLQIHCFDPKEPIYKIMETLQKLKEEGQIRIIGCSNFNSNEYNAYSKVIEENGFDKIDSFQMHYNLIERRAEEELLPLCKEQNMTIIINRALARGILTGKYKNNQPLPKKSRAIVSVRVKKWLEKGTLDLISDLERFANEKGKTITELANAWLLSKHEKSLVLVGARNIQQLETSISAVDWQLSKQEFENVDKIINNQHLMKQIMSRPEVFFEK